MGYASTYRRPPVFLGINKNSPQARGLVGWWRPRFASEASGTTVTAFDGSGYGRHGTATDGAAMAVDAVNGHSFYFAQAGGTSDSVYLADADYGIANGFAISCRVKASVSAISSIVGRDNSGGSRFWQFRFDADGTIRLIRFNSSNSVVSNFNTSTAWDDNEWHSVIATFTGTGSVIYVDGVSRGSDSVTTANKDGTGTGPIIAARSVQQPTSEPLTGWVTDVRFYNRGVSAGEASEMHRNPYDLWLQPRFYVPSEQAAVAPSTTSSNLLLLGVG